MCVSTQWRSEARSCEGVYDPKDRNPPGSSVRGVLQATILEQVALPSSRGSSWPRDRTHVSCIAGRFFPVCRHPSLNPYSRLTSFSTPQSSKHFLYDQGSRQGCPLWPFLIALETLTRAIREEEKRVCCLRRSLSDQIKASWLNGSNGFLRGESSRCGWFSCWKYLSRDFRAAGTVAE